MPENAEVKEGIFWAEVRAKKPERAFRHVIVISKELWLFQHILEASQFLGLYSEMIMYYL